MRREGCRAEAHGVVEVGGHRVGRQVLLAYPEELPGEAGGTADGDLERPAEHAAVDEFLQRLDGCAEAVERVGEAEPSVEAEDAVVLLHGFHHLLTLADGTRHGLLAPDVLTCLSSLDSHQGVPVRRRGDVDDIDVGVVDEVAEVSVGLDLHAQAVLGLSDSLLQMVGVAIAERHETATLIAGEMITAASDTSDADNTLRKLIARSDMLGTTQHAAWNDGEQ